MYKTNIVNRDLYLRSLTISFSLFSTNTRSREVVVLSHSLVDFIFFFSMCIQFSSESLGRRRLRLRLRRHSRGFSLTFSHTR